MTFLWLIIIVLIAVPMVALVLEKRRHPVDRAARKGAPGKFADLSQGVTHYRWHGPVRGPVLVAIHGLTTPSVVWDVLADGLGAMGYRVLTYDLYGRGLSDAPEGVQDRAFFLRQLNDLLADQGIKDDVTVLGYSMGGSIATAFAETHPHRVKRLLLLATAGVEVVEDDFTKFCRTKPIIGDLAHNLLGAFRMRKEILSDTRESEIPGLHDAQIAQLDRRGYLKAVLASRRGMLDEMQKEAHQKIGREDIPVIAIWAENDAVIPLSALGMMAQWNRNVRQETIPNAGHAMAATHATAIVDLLRDLLIEPS